MGETTLKHLSKHGTGAILVTNRSLRSRLRPGLTLSRNRGSLRRASTALAKADIVVSSTSTPNYVLDAAMVSAAMTQRSDRPLLLVDLAVPRDIDPAALNLNAVYLYKIDQLSEVGPPQYGTPPNRGRRFEKLVAAHALAAAVNVLGTHDRLFRHHSPAVFQPFDLPAQPNFVEFGLSPATASSSAFDTSAHPVGIGNLRKSLPPPYARNFTGAETTAFGRGGFEGPAR